MRDLVHDGERGVARLAERDLVRVEQEPRLAERHAPEVLHRAEGEIREGNEITLLTGIRNPVIVGEELQREPSHVECEASEVRLAGNVRDAQGNSSRVDRRGELERADDPRDEVR